MKRALEEPITNDPNKHQKLEGTTSPSSSSSPAPVIKQQINNIPVCTICNTAENVIDDFRNGCVVCTSCGLQIGGQLISQGAEWRTFADDGSKNTSDPSRVGSVDDAIRGLGTTIAGGGALGHRHNQASTSLNQQTMERVLRLCKTYQKRLLLENQIYVEAERICKIVVEAPIELRGKTLKQDTLAAVCVHLACRAKSQDRKKTDIIAVADLNEKAFNKQFQRVTNILHHNSKESGIIMKAVPRTEAANFVKRYGQSLSLSNAIVDIADHIVRAASELDISGSAQPANLAIAALNFVYLIDSKPDIEFQKQMLDLATINPDTLLKLTKVLHEHRLSLVPFNYKPKEVIEKMPKPEKFK